jgi:hypothetical protein
LALNLVLALAVAAVGVTLYVCWRWAGNEPRRKIFCQ